MMDCHCHILPREFVTNLEKFSRLDAYFGLLATTKGSRFVTGEDLLRDMAAYHVDRAVVFGFAFRDTGICRDINDYVAGICRENPGKLVGLGVLDPESPGALEEAERCLELGLSGFGELFPDGHGYSLDSSGLLKLAGIAKDAGVPLLIHVNEQVGHEYPGKGLQGPREAYKFCVRNPDVKVVFAHLGGGLPFFYYMPEVRALENVYYDTAAQPFLYVPGVYRGLKESGALSRVILGTDYPLLSWERYVRDLSKAGLSFDDIDGVISRHGEEVFGEFFETSREGNRKAGQNTVLGEGKGSTEILEQGGFE
ncbi:MAG TPA: amidohydrolase family protein [Firmicutes bacterium]|nr:amidohydrolase family protein [Candidatus Fermentithermobacillaceae bacterium]